MLVLASLLLSALPAQGAPSVKHLFDGRLPALRLAQESDGSYGDRRTTAEALIAFALCPRSYRSDDGPFVRDGLRWLLAASQEAGDPAADRVAALALLCLGADDYAPRIAELAARGGVDLARLRELVQDGTWEGPIPEGLPIPAADTDAASILMGLAEHTPRAQLAEACARAGLALRRSSAARTHEAPDADAVYARGVAYLLQTRGKSGLWEFAGHPEPGISGLAARALLGSPDPEARAAALPVLDYLRGLQKKDGSIHAGHLPVYVTSVAIMALQAGGREEDRAAIESAADFLRAVQADQGEGYSESDKFYGGVGYGDDLRPDLSNLQFALQALHASGAGADDPAFQRALIFLQRTQNRSESNPGTYHRVQDGAPVHAGNDGGATYMPGDSPAGFDRLPDGSLVARSYGSMTYALLKCYVFAGLPADDPRLVAAQDWIAKHWTLEVNPGFDMLRDPRGGFQGLYYYYLSLAEALSAAGLDHLKGADGSLHDWRAELVAKLADLQHADGSWVNSDAQRWWEGNPVLCTSYALDALQAARR